MSDPHVFFTSSKSKKNWARHAVYALADDRRLPTVVELQSPFVLRGLCGHRKIKTFRPPAHYPPPTSIFRGLCVCISFFYSTQEKEPKKKKETLGELGGLLPPPHQDQSPFSCEVTLPYWNTRRRWNERTVGGLVETGESLLEKLLLLFFLLMISFWAFVVCSRWHPTPPSCHI